MLIAAQVQADVVNIDRPAALIPQAMVADANVLYWMFYPNFGPLALAGGRVPLAYQRNRYPTFWAQAARLGGRLWTSTTTVGEFVKTAEFAELETIWRMDPALPQPDPARRTSIFDPRVCKFARYHYSRLLPSIRNGIESLAQALLGSVSLLHSAGTFTQEMNHWSGSLADHSDAVLVTAALNQGIDAILSDDSDLATFPGITLYTANRRIVDAARIAGKLR